jgi:hypothetical protein
VIFTASCIFYALSLAAFMAWICLTDSLTSNRDLLGFIDRFFHSCLMSLIVLPIAIPPPIPRWFMRLQEHKWKRNVPLLIFFPVIAFLLLLFSVALNLLCCHIKWNFRCGYDLQDSLKDLELWFMSIAYTGECYFILLITIRST